MSIPIWKFICAIMASAMAGATFGFLACAILANSKYRDEIEQAQLYNKRIG